MLRTQRDLLASYFHASKLYTSGVVEGFNLRCNSVKRRAYSLRSYNAQETAVYHNRGKLPEPKTTHRFF